MSAHTSKDFVKARAAIPSLFYFILLFIFPFCSLGQKVNPIVQAAYNDVLNLDFDAARDKLKFLHSNPENNPYSIYVANLADVLQAYTSGSEELFNELKNAESFRLNQINRLPSDKPERYFLEAEIKIQWAFAKFRYGHYLKSFWGFKQAYSVAEKGHELFPEYVPLNKSLGVIHTVLGSFPENYHWLLSMLNSSGDIELGMSELQKLTRSNSIFYEESVAYQSLFQTYLLNEKKQALVKMDELLQSSAPKDVVKAVASLVYFKSSQSQKAEAILLDLEEKGVLNTIPFLKYLMGEINLQKGNYLTAIQFYHNFIHNNKGVNYTKDAYLKIALCHWLNNDRHYKLYMEKALAEGNADIDADKNAEYMATQEQLPNKHLLKIRYATDGGYFEIVEKVLAEINVKNFNNDELLEYHYRLARYYHLTNNLSNALKEYDWVIQKQGDQNFYFAPNACLQSAYIYLELGQKAKAKNLLEKALTYQGHPYESSIDKKAEIELEKLSESN